MASGAPKLPPVQEFEPLDMSSQNQDVEKIGAKFSSTKITEHEVLESGAPVTKAEADFIHSPLAKNTEKKQPGCACPCAQEKAAADKAAGEKTKEKTEEKTEEKTPKKKTDSENLPPAIQGALKKEENYQNAKDLIEPKILNAPETVTKKDAALLKSRDARAHGTVEKGGLTAQV